MKYNYLKYTSPKGTVCFRSFLREPDLLGARRLYGLNGGKVDPVSLDEIRETFPHFSDEEIVDQVGIEI